MRNVRIKQVAEVRYGLGQPPQTAEGGVPILRATNIERGRINPAGLIHAAPVDLPLSRVPLLRAGEVLVVRSGANTGDSARVTDEWVGAAPGYDLRLTPRAIDSRFLAYQLLSRPVLDQIDLVKSRAAQPHLNAEGLGDVIIESFSREEERAIADYLDAETARIDALVASRGRSVALLEARFESAIWLAVTKGLDNAPWGPLGIDWADPIPEHWGTPSIGQIFEVQLGKMLNPEATSSGEQFAYLRNENVQWDRIDVTDLNSMHFNEDERIRFKLQPGDLLVCEGGEAGRAAIWNGELADCYYQKALHRLRARGPMATSRYLLYVLMAAAGRGTFAAEGNTSTIVHLTAEKLRAHRIPLPPVDEQAEIVKYLDSEARQLSATRAAFQRQIALLLERRQAVITAAVSGAFAIPRQVAV